VPPLGAGGGGGGGGGGADMIVKEEKRGSRRAIFSNKVRNFIHGSILQTLPFIFQILEGLA
jgi:hypothetical protein